MSQSVSRLRLRREHLRRSCKDAVRARSRGRGPRPPSASGAGEHRRLAGGRVQTAAGGDCTGSGSLSVRRVRGCGGRRHLAPLAARPGLGCRRRALLLARCGRVQGAAGETVTSVLSGDGASGRFQSSSERPERALDEGQGWGASFPRPAPNRGARAPRLPGTSSLKVRALSAQVEAR